MALYVIADLHLAHTLDKPMDIFGPKWENHTEKIRENWLKTVTEEDTVVIAGDISWGMRMTEAEEDFRFIDALPGKKIIVKGNHDFWWGTMKKLNEFCEGLKLKTISFLYNNAFETDEFILCGTRGWLLESGKNEDDERITQREVGRLQRSIDCGKQLASVAPGKEILVFLHYPPAYGNLRCNPICEVIAENHIRRVFYGHMHNADGSRLVRQIAGASSELIAADWVNFCPVKIEKK